MQFLRGLLFLITAAFHSSVLFSQETTTVEIVGKIKGDYAGKMFLFFEDRYREKDSISSVVTNGAFYFKCELALPILGRIHLGENSLIDDFFIDQQQVFLDCSNTPEQKHSENENYTFNWLTIDSVKGSKMEETLRDFCRPLHINFPAEIFKIDTSGYIHQLDAFVQQNSGSKIAPYMISLCSGLSSSRLHSLYDKVAPSLINTAEMKRIRHLIDQKERTEVGLLSKGMPFHDITLTNNKGRQINTKELQGNYFLIVCWASWCAPCRNENPALRSMFTKYKDKGLTMVGISFDQSTPKWMNAIRKDHLPWTQLVDTRGYEGDFAKYYGIASIPTIFLLDKDRKIITTGPLEEIAKKLSALL